MAIQNRRGVYSDFDPTRMVEGEFAVVQSGDPDTIDGKAVYISTQTGSVERVALYKDVTQAVSTAIDEVTEDVIEDINEGVAENVEKAETAADNAEASAEEAAEILENKADIDGTYDNLVVGNLLSNRTQTDTAPYLFRKTASELGSSRIGQRCYPALVGASVGENQLIGTLATSTVNGITLTNNGDGSYTANGTASANAYFYFNVTTSVIQGHKYIIKGCASGGSNNTYQLSFRVNNASTVVANDNGNGAIGSPSSTFANGTVMLRVLSGQTLTNAKFIPQLIDLTLLLGSSIADYAYTLEQATAGSGIAWFRSYGFLTDGYVPYNPGAIESVEVTEKVVTGFNQWDEELESGALNTVGELVNNPAETRSKNFIPALGNTTYYVKAPLWLVIFQYDADHNFLLRTPLLGGGQNPLITTLANTRYLKFMNQSAYGKTYNHDICINLSSSRNGEYEPYKSTTYSLGSDTLRGIFKLDASNNIYADGDRKEADGTITRKYGVVDLGTLTWTWQSTWQSWYTDYILNMKGTSAGTETPPFISDKYQPIATNYGLEPNNYIGITSTVRSASGCRILVKNGSSSDSPTGTLVYELQTPTTEQSTPFTSPQTVYPDGTEQFVTENGVPVGHETEYPYDLKALVEGLIDVPDVPSANGTYVLKATRSASGIVYNWVSE